MGNATLGGLTFRVDPSQVAIDYSMNVAVTPTVGGRVVQVHGMTWGDLTVRGLFGQDRASRKESWQLAEDFKKSIERMADVQSARPTNAQLLGIDPTPMNPPFRFTFNDVHSPARGHLPAHEWDFNVYIKDLRAVDSTATVEHTTGKFSYGYTLTLFVVQDNTGKLQQVAQNAFVDRLATGLGWKRSAYNGFLTAADLQSYLGGSNIHDWVLKQYSDASSGNVPSTSGGN